MTAYKRAPVFDTASLPAAIRNEHRTKAGTWGLLHVLEGEVHLHFIDPPRVVVVVPGVPGLICPEEPHFAEPIGNMRMQIEFHDSEPVAAGI